MTGWNAQDAACMKEALNLARKGWGLVSPNPMVGAVLAKNGRIIATGWHMGPGSPHAEAAAIAAAGRKAKGASLYVNLEPCSHFGLTPPCTEAIIKAGITEVFYSIADPNTLAAGGAQTLKEAGIATHVGLLEEEAAELNQFFLKWILTKEPFVILKSAASLDGKTATHTGESRWITGKSSRNFAHHIRAGVDAILVGRGTAAMDNPELSARPWGKRKMHKQPLRIVLDSKLKLPLDYKIFDQSIGGPTVIVCAEGANPAKQKKITDLGHQVWQAPPDQAGHLSLKWILKKLGHVGLQSVLIEPGATLAASALLEEQVVDLAHIFLAPKLIGGHKAPGLVGGPGLEKLAAAPEAEIIKVGRRKEDIHLVLRPAGGFCYHDFKEALCLPV